MKYDDSNSLTDTALKEPYNEVYSVYANCTCLVGGRKYWLGALKYEKDLCLTERSVFCMRQQVIH